jgi:hypothetical protein
MDLNSLQTKINSYTSVVSSWLKNNSKLFYSSKPETVKIKMLDDNGNITEVNVPNIAKVKADFDAKKQFSHSMGIKTNPTGNLNNGKGLALGDGDTGFRQNGDGVLETFANNRKVSVSKSSEHRFLKDLVVDNVGDDVNVVTIKQNEVSLWSKHNDSKNRQRIMMNMYDDGSGAEISLYGKDAHVKSRVLFKDGEVHLIGNDGKSILKTDANHNTTAYGDITLQKNTPFINFKNTASGDTNTDVAIGVSGENFYIREPEDKGKEWFRIEDDREAYIMGNKINTIANTKFHSGAMKASDGYGYITPPSGYSIGHLKAVVVSPHAIFFDGDVNGDDTIYCRVRSNNDGGRIKVECRNSEQRENAWFNFLTIWQK